MSEEQTIESIEENPSEVEESSYTEAETEAMKFGWKPKDEWEGDPDEWVPARVFNQRGELFGEIKSLKHKVREQDLAFQQMQKMLEKASESEYKRAMDDLKRQKREALEMADHDTVMQIDEQIDQAKEQYKSSTAQPQAQANPTFDDWRDKNIWYVEDDDMASFADTAGALYAQRNPQAEYSKVLEHVTKQVKKAFPEKFSNQNRSQESKVEGASNSGSKRTVNKNKITVKDLSEDDRRVVTALIRSGAIKDEQEWIDENVRKGYLTV